MGSYDPGVKYASLLIRLWHSGKVDEPSACRFEVEHIQSGKSWAFSSLKELEDFLGQKAVDKLTWIDIPGAEINGLGFRMGDV